MSESSYDHGNELENNLVSFFMFWFGFFKGFFWGGFLVYDYLFNMTVLQKVL